MKNRLFYSNLMWLMCLLTANLCSAQAQHTEVKPFFPKNFVKRQRFDDSKQRNSGKQRNIQAQTRKDKSSANQHKESLNSNVLPRDREFPLQALSGYVWGGDPMHVRDAVRELVDASVDKGIGIDRITIVAPPNKLLSIGVWLGLSPYTETGEDRDMVQRYVRVSDRFELIPELPESVSFITRSPAWVLHSEQGDIILESAWHKLEYYLHENGNANLHRLRVHLLKENSAPH